MKWLVIVENGKELSSLKYIKLFTPTNLGINKGIKNGIGIFDILTQEVSKEAINVCKRL